MSVNKVILVGNLGNDPETRHLANGSTVANISVATSESWKDKQTGEKKSKTEWHRVVFFNRLAEVVSEYLKKGSKIYIEGRLQTEKWTDKNGIERYTTKVYGDRMQMLGYPPEQQNQPNNKPAQENKGVPSFNNENPPPSFDDDIPF